jgi:hypothetical protein
MLSLLGSTLLDPFAPHLNQPPPQSANRKTRREKEIEVEMQEDDDNPNVEGDARVEDGNRLFHLGKRTDRLNESLTADLGVALLAASVKTKGDKKAAKTRRKRKPEGKAKKDEETAVKSPPAKKKKQKEKTQF